jgi:uncharacterized protein (DUF3820 family)
MAESLGKITFGKFKEHDIEDIPDSYLNWIKGEQWFKIKEPKLCNAIKTELVYRNKFDLHIIEDREE